MRNLSSGGANPSQWAKVAASNLEHLSRSESKKILAEAIKEQDWQLFSETFWIRFRDAW
jgi:hypothetical protein